MGVMRDHRLLGRELSTRHRLDQISCSSRWMYLGISYGNFGIQTFHGQASGEIGFVHYAVAQNRHLMRRGGICTLGSETETGEKSEVVGSAHYMTTNTIRPYEHPPPCTRHLSAHSSIHSITNWTSVFCVSATVAGGKVEVVWFGNTPFSSQ